MGSAAFREATKAIREWDLHRGTAPDQPSHPTESFGSLSFNDSVQKSRLPKGVYKKLKETIDAQKRSLTDFVNVKQAELDEMAKRLGETDAFSQGLYKQIQNVAETEGYSLVLNLKSGDSVMNSVLWYSPMIDITADVIAALTGKPPAP